MNEKHSATLVTDAQRARLLEQALASVAPSVRAWTAPEVLSSTLAEALDAQIEMTRDLGFAVSFFEQCRLPGTEPAHYLQRCLALPDGHLALVGIRFKGMDLSKPFVDLVGQSFPLSDGAALSAAVSAIEAHYEIFAPKWVRIPCWRGTPVTWPAEARLSPDLCYLAAPVASIQQRPLPSGCDRLVLRACRDMTFYPHYRVVHDAFRERSSLGQEVSPSSESDLEACLEGGALFEAFVGEHWAGLIAAARETQRGLRGFCVYEEILAARFRGQGLAAAMQRQMIDALDGGGGALIFGTIHHNNAPSLATARRVGREEVCRYTFLHLPTGQSRAR